MNLNFGRTDRTNQEMDSSLTASLLLLSVVFMQFVSAADQNNTTIKAEPGENVILTCKDPDQGKITIAEWKRTDLGTEYVLLYKDYQLDPGAQHPSYRDRVDLLCIQLRKGDVSLLLKDTTTNDSGTYECRIDTEKHVGELISTISLQVSPPPPPEQFPFWAIVLLVLLVLLVLAAAAGVSVYFWLRWKPGESLELHYP
ncbi:PREDICTED: butyrophilin subfamily 1 member A1-like isoform X1 [Poecilia mexicana]|uniref:butyrophilin subfamily 1 member A1-like isoform X1 n=1 Tax=Poecilia mexicana TaxID=48701 RepID=UPI00072DB6E5|nr:PREDICTED: butyrophilin subfamily 1 member A1-like isoform X1 [Poecilia mexicana]